MDFETTIHFQRKYLFKDSVSLFFFEVLLFQGFVVRMSLVNVSMMCVQSHGGTMEKIKMITAEIIRWQISFRSLDRHKSWKIWFFRHLKDCEMIQSCIGNKCLCKDVRNISQYEERGTCTKMWASLLKMSWENKPIYFCKNSFCVL